jgi:hypothetical protein
MVMNVLDAKNKKTDVAEHPKAFRHVGLLFNKPPGRAELLFIQSSDPHSLYGTDWRMQ